MQVIPNPMAWALAFSSHFLWRRAYLIHSEKGLILKHYGVTTYIINLFDKSSFFLAKNVIIKPGASTYYWAYS